MAISSRVGAITPSLPHLSTSTRDTDNVPRVPACACFQDELLGGLAHLIISGSEELHFEHS